MTDATAEQLQAHLIRSDGQEDVCLATYRPSTGASRRTALLTHVVPPLHGDRAVHGNATVYSQYVLRAIELAVSRGEGLVIAHSHPRASSWQFMSAADQDAEASFANLAREATGLPLVGMTLAGRSRTWSARHWDRGVGSRVDVTHSENVRVIGSRFAVSWNDELRPPGRETSRQIRTVSSWGRDVHEDITRLRVLVVGLGSVGLDVAVRLAATGFRMIGIADYDDIELHNLDRMIGATGRDVLLRRTKVDVARRLMTDAATASEFQIISAERSICETAGVELALDFDLIISCVDRPWARAVMNTLAYADLIPVIDGGIALDTFEDGTLRSGTWRSHVVRPGRPCMSCNGQLDLGDATLEIEGLLDDPSYVVGAHPPAGGQNVAALSCSVSASLLAQLVSFLVAPGGQGDPGPLQYILSTHTLERLSATSRDQCPVEASECVGDDRVDLTGHDAAAVTARESRSHQSGRIRFLRAVDNAVTAVQRRIGAGPSHGGRNIVAHQTA